MSDLNPIAFETTHFPLNTDLYSPYRTRKVTMYIKVKALNMPAPVEQRFIELTRYPPVVLVHFVSSRSDPIL